MRANMKIWIYSGISAFLILPACQPNQAVMRANASDKKQEILRIIPLGSSYAKARELMTANGYRCEVSNEPFIVVNNGRQERVRTGLNYLYCDKRESASYLVTRRWQIAVVNQNEKVSDIFVSTGLAGP